MTDEHAAQAARVRSALPPNRAHVDPKEVERVVFAEVGHRDLGLALWTDAGNAATQAWRTCRQRMRARYGARSPHGGWLTFVLFAAVLVGAFAAGVASGFRTDPTQTVGILIALVITAAAADLLALLVAGPRPLNWAAIRMQIAVAVTLLAATAFQLSRPANAATPFVLSGAAIAVAGVVVVFSVRAMKPEERVAIDNAINIATEQMQPEVDAIGQRLQSEVLAQLSKADQDRIVSLRTVTLADLADEGLVFEPVPQGTPAGGVIIAAQLSTWNPHAPQGA